MARLLLWLVCSVLLGTQGCRSEGRLVAREIASTDTLILRPGFRLDTLISFPTDTFHYRSGPFSLKLIPIADSLRLTAEHAPETLRVERVRVVERYTNTRAHRKAARHQRQAARKAERHERKLAKRRAFGWAVGLGIGLLLLVMLAFRRLFR